MQCEGETDDGELKYSNTMPAQNSHTVCVHLYHLEHSRTATRPARDYPLPLCLWAAFPLQTATQVGKFMYKLT